MRELTNRRRYTEDRLNNFVPRLQAAQSLLEGKACVYATGSFGRGEASFHSDLDLVIVGRHGGEARSGIQGSLLSRLDEICVKAELIQEAKELNFPEFDADGRYLVHYSVQALIKTLGKPEDDASNTFTTRLLVLLEGRPILGTEVHNIVIDEIIAKYWEEYEDHKSNFVPPFLVNDILRLWRTFCVNYEARTDRQPPKNKKRRVKNYKLKYSRLLKCYSAILMLLAMYSKHETISVDDAKEMIRLSPTKRLDWILKEKNSSTSHSIIRELLSGYGKFLKRTDKSEDELIEDFDEKSNREMYMSEATLFGDQMFQAVDSVGGRNRLHRICVV